MFLYKDSKLETDIKQLNSKLNKTEYEKAREPLQRQIAILNKKLYEKDIALQSLYQVCKEFLHNNIKNRQIIVMKNEPHLFYGAVSDIEFEKLETIKIDLSDYKRVLKKNEELLEVKVSASAHNRILELEKENKALKEYIAIAPNLYEMAATKYRNIQQDAYIQGRAEEQQKAEQIICENYIPIQKIKDKIEELDIKISECEYSDDDDEEYKKAVEKDKLFLLNQKRVLQELLEKRR